MQKGYSMVLKDIDSKENEIKLLKELLSKSKSDKQKRLIEQELKKVENGYRAEKENAYYLNFNFDKDYYTLLHDIRIEHNGKVAQIDHLLITRHEIVVLESKSFKGTLTINRDGSLSINYGKYKKTLPNPIEQNSRHIQVLKEFLEDKIDIPVRIKLLGGLPINSKVLIHPNTTITNKKLPEGFARSDSFFRQRQNEIEKESVLETLSGASKIMSKDLRTKIISKLIGYHKPIKIDYEKKFPIKKEDTKEIADIICPRCKEGKLVERVRKRKSDKYENSKFLGCSRFPKCRYTEEIKEIA